MGSEPDETRVERRTCRADGEVTLDRGARLGLELLVEVGGDVAPSPPAVQRLGQARSAFRIPVAEHAHEHHPSAAEPLFGRRQPDPECLGDGRDRPAGGVVEDDDGAVPGRQADEGVLELVAQLGAGEDLFGIDGVIVVVPAILDVGNGELVAMGARAVDDEVEQDPVQPRPDRGAVAELPPAGPGPQGGLLGELLSRRRVAGQVYREAGKAG